MTGISNKSESDSVTAGLSFSTLRLVQLSSTVQVLSLGDVFTAVLEELTIIDGRGCSLCNRRWVIIIRRLVKARK